MELDQFKDRFQKWIAPSLVDLEAVFDHEFNEAQDWDTAFQMAQKKQEESSSLAKYD